MRSLLILSFFGISHAFKPADKSALKTAVDACVDDTQDGSECYACVDGTTKTSAADCGNGEIAQFISNWDTSLVKDMTNLFYNKKKFNQPLNWDTSSVTRLRDTFRRAEEFNQDLYWDTSSVTDMEYTFQYATKMNSKLPWDTSSVTSMGGMFGGTGGDATKTQFNQDISRWDVSQVKDLSYMFWTSKFNQDISCWDVSSVTKFNGMFEGNTVFSQTLCWDTSGGDTEDMFKQNTGSVGSCTASGCTADGAACSTDSDCISGACDTTCQPRCEENEHVSGGSCQACAAFKIRPAGDDPAGADTACETARFKPADKAALEAAVDACVPDQTADGSECYACLDGTTKVSDVAKYTKDTRNPIYLCGQNWGEHNGNLHSFTTLPTGWKWGTASGDKWLTIEGLGADKETEIVAASKALAHEINAIVFDGKYHNDKWVMQFFTAADSCDNEHTSSVFADQGFIRYDLSGGDCAAGDTPIFISYWDTSLVTDMKSIFQLKKAFNQDISRWNTAKVTDMKLMFNQAEAFNHSIADWDTAQVTEMEKMFSYTNDFNQNINDWDVSAVTDFQSMFQNSNFNQPLDKWDIGAADLSVMFHNNPKFNQDISSWDTSSVTDMYGVFESASSFNQDLSCWDISSTSRTEVMFRHTALDKKLCWDLSGVTHTNQMFIGTTGSVDSCTAACAANGEACAAAAECVSGLCTDSLCAPTHCAENQRALGGACVACPAGKTNTAGDPVASDSTCDPTICDEDHHVVNNICQPCALGTKPAGDDASKGDTTCDIGPCGGLTCGRGTCVNDVCECPLGYSGMTCDRDVTAAGLQDFLKSKRKPLATEQDKKETRKQIRTFIKDTLKKALLTKTVKEAIQETKVAVDRSDLKEKTNLVVLQLEKQPVIALASENKDVLDTCSQGINSASCGMLDIKENPHEVVFLNTQEEAGSWSVLNSGNLLLSKQTRVTEDVYDMQCWNNTDWSEKVRFDTTSSSDMYECNNHIILIGSQAAVCTTDTCKNGGTCTPDGYSFTCTCPPNYYGNTCQNVADITHCHQIDCSDFGGHKGDECTDCSYSVCCNYATKTLFNDHCDTLSATQDYVNAKCCHRTYCI